jgi:hypothetical protein
VGYFSKSRPPDEFDEATDAGVVEYRMVNSGFVVPELPPL